MVQYKYDAWGNVITEVIDEAHAGIAELNPFRYRSYYYDRETNLYYLNTRYYDPETGRFISQDDVSYLDPEHINGLNLYAYCGNNPVMNVDPNGQSLIAILIILAVATIIGAVVGGIVAYDNGARGVELFGWIMLGAAIGLAAGGALIALGAVCVGAVAGVGAAFLGTTAAQAFAVGSLAFDFFAFVVAPILGITMDGIELSDSAPDVPELPTVTYSSWLLKMGNSVDMVDLIQYSKKEKKDNNVSISWRNIRKLSALYN